MNSASIRGSFVGLCSIVRVVGNRVYCSSRYATSVPRCCYSTFWSFRSSERCCCVVQTRRNHDSEAGSRPSMMSGRSSKSKKKDAKNQARIQSQSATPDTEKPKAGNSEAIDAETGPIASGSQSPIGERQTEAMVAEETIESAAVSDIHPTKTDNNPESFVFGTGLRYVKERVIEKTETTESCLFKSTIRKVTTAEADAEKEENVPLTSNTNESNVDVEVEEVKYADEALKQSNVKALDHQDLQLSDKTESHAMAEDHQDMQPSDKTESHVMAQDHQDMQPSDKTESHDMAVDHQDMQPSDKTESHVKALDHQGMQPSDKTRGDLTTDSGSRESEQKNDDKVMPSSNSPVEAKNLEKNNDFSSRFVLPQAPVLTVNHPGNSFSDRKLQDPKSFHGTRQAAITQERAKFLKMTPEEKRRFSGKKNVVVLEDIDTWKDYYQDNARQLKKCYPDANRVGTMFKGGFPQYEVDDELNTKVSIYTGDITALQVDGIVNAANSSLLGGGGVDGAIHSAAGTQLLEECKRLSGCRTGDAKTTCGYLLPAKYVIHTVGPQGKYPNELRSCYNRCLDEMLKHEMRTIAFCCISTGIYGYPNDLAVHVALATVRQWLGMLKQKNQLHLIDRVIFCLFLQVDVTQYNTWMQAYFPIPGHNNADKGAQAKFKDNKVPSNSDHPAKADKGEEKLKSISPAKDGAEEDKLQSSISGKTTCPTKKGKDEDKLKKSCLEPASMDIEEVFASDEDMEQAEDGAAGAKQVGGTESPDKKCKLDPAAVG